MWKWTCPNSPGLIYEHHSWKSLNVSLTGHEDGLNVLGLCEIAPCNSTHEYFDDGKPCSNRGRGCHIPYVRNDEPEFHKNYVD